MLASEAIGLVLRKRTAIPPLNALAYLRDVMYPSGQPIYPE